MVVKIIDKKSCSMNNMKLQEIRQSLKMHLICQHYHVVRVEDYFEDIDNIYICMEHLSK